jgi:hypothetical protein
MKKFLNVEIIVCLADNTWYTDYVLIPYPDGGEMLDDTKFKAIQKWTLEETVKNDKRPESEIIPTVGYIGVYNINWDEPVDENGDFIDD